MMESAYFFHVKTTKGLVFYECWGPDEAIRMAIQDGYEVIEVDNVDTRTDDIIDFAAYGNWRK